MHSYPQCTTMKSTWQSVSCHVLSPSSDEAIFVKSVSFLKVSQQPFGVAILHILKPAVGT